jgi:hypothetical protein
MANIELDGANKKIKVDSGDLTLDVPGDIILDADGADVVFADGGTNILKVTNSSSDVVFQPQVDAKDIIFKQYDGTTVATVEDNATFNIPASKLAIGGTAVTSTAAELNILDGVTATATELNLIDGVTATTAELNILDGVTATASELNLLDGGTSVGSSITLADADGFVVNDGGTMKTIPATDVSTYVGSGGLQFISTTTASSSSGVNINGPFTTTYDHYLVTYNITFSSDGAKARVRFQNTSNAEQSDTYHQSSLRANNETAVNGFNSTSYFVLNDNGQSDFSTIPLTGHMYVSGPRVSDARCGFRNFATTSDAGREGGFEISAGHLNENTEISGIKIYPSAGNFAAATIRIYGIANS